MTRRLALLILSSLPFATLGLLLAYDASVIRPSTFAVTTRSTPTANATASPGKESIQAGVTRRVSAPEATTASSAPAASTPIVPPTTVIPSPTLRASPTLPAPSATREPPQASVAPSPTYQAIEAHVPVERRPAGGPAQVVAAPAPIEVALPEAAPLPNIVPAPTAAPTLYVAPPPPSATEASAAVADVPPQHPAADEQAPTALPLIVDTLIQPTAEPVMVAPVPPASVADPPVSGAPDVPSRATAERDDNSGSGSIDQGTGGGDQGDDATNDEDNSSHGNHDDAEDDNQDHVSSDDDNGGHNDD